MPWAAARPRPPPLELEPGTPDHDERKLSSLELEPGTGSLEGGIGA